VDPTFFLISPHERRNKEEMQFFDHFPKLPFHLYYKGQKISGQLKFQSESAMLHSTYITLPDKLFW
jgi:hypothetical protein